jgi:hypothetical protein
MKIKDHLSKEIREHLYNIRNTRKKRKRKKEKLSEKDIKSLMGMNRATYRRGKGGAFKQR